MRKAIRVAGLSKAYRIGELDRRATFRETLANFIKHPFPSLSHETFWALKNISFEIDKGEVVGIIGRNGAGKSTLLKMLAKISYPTDGTISVDGRVGSLLEVGTGFHPELTGRENILLNGSILGMTRQEIRHRTDDIIAFAGVEKFIDTPIKRYSSGMRLRLGFSVAAHLEVDVLLVDEVLAVGDGEFQKKCLKTMEKMHRSGRTVLFVSHNMAAVENLCPRAIWIDEGQIRGDGTAQEIINDYMASFGSIQGSGIDLRHVEDRSGSGEIIYTKIQFLDPDHRPKDTLRSGDKVIIRLDYQAFKHVLSPSFGVEIYTVMGTKVTSMNTWSSGFDVASIEPGDGHLELEIQSLNLIPGRYYLTLWLDRVGQSYDRLEHCTTIDIESSDVLASGRSLDSRFGFVFFPVRWQHFC
jgi:lipopolysaccharide transport system ATP-binding protein